MTVDQALSGHWLMPGSQELMPPEEHDEAFGTIQRGREPWAERVQRLSEQSHSPESMLKDWSVDHKGFLVGDTHAVAAKVRDFTRLMDVSGAENPSTLYRGAAVDPKTHADDVPISYTEDPNVAKSFTAPKYLGKRGSIFKLAPGEARGVRLADFGVDVRTVGQNRRPEREFLVDPRSLRRE